ncbi:MAG: ACP S-malonyltransferase [Mariprofundaceae bacterium]
MNEQGQLAYIFPGQGSQSTGMLADHLQANGPVRDTFAEASDALGYDMQALVIDNADGLLDRTDYTQPALLTASVALWRLWRERGGAAAGIVAGHSLGEYSALVAAGSLTFIDAVRLVRFRGEAMAKAAPEGEGRMAAVLGLDDERIGELCAQASDAAHKVWAANFNCPGQVVIAGHAPAVDRAVDAAKPMGAKRALPLAVSAPSHTPLMQPAADAMRQRLNEVNLSDPSIPLVCNCQASVLEHADAIKEALVDQLVMPVRWTDSVVCMRGQGVSHAVEIGPGIVLAGLLRRIGRDIKVHLTETPAAMDESLQALGG